MNQIVKGKSDKTFNKVTCALSLGIVSVIALDAIDISNLIINKINSVDPLIAGTLFIGGACILGEVISILAKNKREE